MEAAVKYVEAILTPLLDNPSELKVTSKSDEMGILVEVSVNQRDMGLVIGKAGETAKSIRNLVRILGMKNRARVTLKINEPANASRPAPDFQY